MVKSKEWSESFTGNKLIKALPQDVYAQLLPHFEQVSLTLGEVIYQANQNTDYLYFPINSMIALLNTMENGMTAEVGLVGNEGVVGIALFLGGVSTSNQAIVQIAGDAVKLRAKIVLDEFKHGGAFQQVLLRYTQAFITQISQTAICNRLHSLEQHFCRWLLLSHDCVKSDKLEMTQELIASMLGGRRESVTIAAGRLQNLGLIHYARGHITILDRKGLEATVCECYKEVKIEYKRILGFN